MTVPHFRKAHARTGPDERRSRLRRGRIAEALAAATLMAKGYRILGRRVKTRSGEIDIIAVRETELMQAARAKGCKVVGGRPMVELQLDAQLAFIGAPPMLGS